MKTRSYHALLALVFFGTLETAAWQARGASGPGANDDPAEVWLSSATQGSPLAGERNADGDPMPDWDAPDWGHYGPSSRWTARLGAAILQRSNPPSQPILSSLRGPTLLDAHDFDFGTAGSPDAYLLHQGDRADLDLRYFGVAQWASPTQHIFAPEGLQFDFADPTQTQIDAPTAIGMTYFSSLQSAEANLRRNVTSQFTLLAGFRYIGLREHIAVNIDIDGESFLKASLGAIDNLYGFQVGADAILFDTGARFRVEGVVKAGVYGNAAKNSFAITQDGQSNLVVTNRDHTAFVGDINLTGVYRFSDRWALRAGYQLLWIAGVALASDQFHMINPGDRGGVLGVDTSGNPFYHGALVGLESNW